MNTAQVKQDVSELFLVVAWPKQLGGNQKMIAFIATNNVGEDYIKPQIMEGNCSKLPNQGKKPQFQLNHEVATTLHSPQIGEKSDSQS